MLRKILKWTGIFIVFLILIAIAFYAVAYFRVNSRANKVYAVNLQQLAIPDDSASYEMGKHTAAIRGCFECHGDNLGGKVFMSDSTPVGVLYSSNLTNGQGGISYTDQDWVRALRHGLNKENKSVWFMPSQHTTSHPHAPSRRQPASPHSAPRSPSTRRGLASHGPNTQARRSTGRAPCRRPRR